MLAPSLTYCADLKTPMEQTYEQTVLSRLLLHMAAMELYHFQYCCQVQKKCTARSKYTYSQKSHITKRTIVVHSQILNACACFEREERVMEKRQMDLFGKKKTKHKPTTVILEVRQRRRQKKPQPPPNPV